MIEAKIIPKDIGGGPGEKKGLKKKEKILLEPIKQLCLQIVKQLSQQDKEFLPIWSSCLNLVDSKEELNSKY